MKTNKQSKIKIPKSGFRRSRFNFSHDVNTTFSWGEVQTTQCKLLVPGSKTTQSVQSLIRLAPMVAPTFGRVKYKTFNQFVGMSDICPNFDPMMAQEPVSRNGGAFVPKFVPNIKLGQLSAYVLFGARATLYWVPGNNSAEVAGNLANGKYVTGYRRPKSDGSTWEADLYPTGVMNLISSSSAFAVVNPGIRGAGSGTLPNVADPGPRVVMRPHAMDSSWNSVYAGDGSHTPTDTDYEITLGLDNIWQLLPVDRSVVRDPNSSNDMIAAMNNYDCEVTLDGADYIVEFSITGAGYPDGKLNCCIAFDLSDYGKRLRKIIQGAGYQVDFGSTADVSVLPLLAQYKAWFDVFGLQLFQGWETTSCFRMINLFTNNNVNSVDIQRYTAANNRFASLPGQTSSMNSNNYVFVDFMLGEVANQWYSDNADYISAHMSKLAVSPKVDPSGFISVDTNGDVDFGANVLNAPGNATNGTSEGQNQSFNATGPTVLDLAANNQVHAYINQIQHGEVDAELLKRMYKWTNRNTLLGREIAKILRAQGLGKYVDECKSNFIGSSDTLVTISDVVSQAATADAVLGEYGGRGLQFTEDKTLVFENDEYGYWVTLAAIVPEAGYTQGLDSTLKAISKFDYYNPDWDAIGMEISTKDLVVGANFDVRPTGKGPDATKQGFGFIPRYSKWKVAHNLVNGDFNRHNMRNIYLPYTLDKQISINDFDAYKVTYTQGTGSNYSTGAVWLNRSASIDDLPVACNAYRQPTAYGWLGNFDRIFYNSGKREDVDMTNDSMWTSFIIGFNDFNSDNFLSHAIFDMNCYAPMKPIEDSYGLEDDDPQGKAGAEFVQKA